MSSTVFSADLRDIRFVLHEVLGASAALKAFEAHADLDVELIDSMLDTAYDVARNQLHPLNRVGDREGVTLKDNAVTTPTGFKETFAELAAGGWIGISASAAHGGMALPHIMDTCTGELFTGAAPAFVMYPGLTKAAANLLAIFGRREVCDRDQQAAAVNHFPLVRVVDGRQRNVLAGNVLPHIELGPIGNGKHAKVLARLQFGIEQGPQLWAL
jgi:hypothetical protein